MDERIIKIQHVLKKELDDNRYQHTLGVMYTAASMAMRYDVDVLKACMPVCCMTAQNVSRMIRNCICAGNTALQYQT